MTQRPSLTRIDQGLLYLGQRLVPAAERSEWLRSWQAELLYLHTRAVRPGHSRSLSLGLLRDALWLRTDSWTVALSGTAMLCLTLLGALVCVAALPSFLFAGSWRAFAHSLLAELPRFAVASSLILLVSYANVLDSLHRNVSGSVLRWFRVRAFSAVKLALLLLLSFLTSTDLCLPLQTRNFFVAIPLQILGFVILALLGLRWSFLDDGHRCKFCLRSLAAPARVGRPSWNFLEYNGTELACRDGHGLLTVPEIETSWCRTSAWISQRHP